MIDIRSDPIRLDTIILSLFFFLNFFFLSEDLSEGFCKIF